MKSHPIYSYEVIRERFADLCPGLDYVESVMSQGGKEKFLVHKLNGKTKLLDSLGALCRYAGWWIAHKKT